MWGEGTRPDVQKLRIRRVSAVFTIMLMKSTTMARLGRTPLPRMKIWCLTDRRRALPFVVAYIIRAHSDSASGKTQKNGRMC